jgi:hypothetical protein
MTPTVPSRRAVLGTFAALPLAALPAVPPAAAPDPDARIIALCAEFTALEQRWQVACCAAKTTEEEDAARAIRDEISPRQAEILDELWDTPAKTQAGIRAKAEAAVVWAPDFLDRLDGGSDGGDLVLMVLQNILGTTSIRRRQEEESEEAVALPPTTDERPPPVDMGKRAEGMLDAIEMMWGIALKRVAEPGSVLTLDRIREVLPIADDFVLEEVA